MPKQIKKNALAVLSVAAVTILAHNPAQAAYGAGEVVRINSHGFETCRVLKDQGAPHWQATASGLLYNTGGAFSGGGNPFFVTTCFESRKTCERWIGRIRHHIDGIEVLRHASCKPR